MRRMISDKAQKYIKELSNSHPDPTAEWGGSGAEYTAGNGIDITNNEISVDTDTIATVSALQSFTQSFGNEITSIYNGTSVVGKAKADENGREIDEYYAAKSELFSGDYNDLTNKPTIPDAALVLTQSTGTLSDADYAKLDENTVIQYNDNGITRLYYFYSDTTTQIEYRTNPIFTNSINGSTYRCIITKADKSYGLNYSIGNNLLPNPQSDGTFKLTNTRSGSTVTGAQWKLDYPDPDTTTAGSYNLEATVDAQGGVTYDWATGGSGGSYTFTNGLTENNGTVSWDLNSNINLNTATSGTITTPGFGIYYNSARKNLIIDSDNGYINQGSTIIKYSSNNVLYGKGNQIRGDNSSNNIMIGTDNKTYNSSGSNVFIGTNNNTDAYGHKYCYLFGANLEVAKDHQTIIGEYNATDTSSVFIVANGTSTSNRSNAMTVSQDGTIISKNLPAVDTTTDGTYVLEATVSNGAVTYNWVLKQ